MKVIRVAMIDEHIKQLAAHVGVNPDPARFYKGTLFASERFLAGIDCYEAGQGDHDHTHTGHDKVYHIVAGVGEFSLAGERRLVGPGSVLWAPADLAHSLTNPGPERLVVFIVMAPFPR